MKLPCGALPCDKQHSVVNCLHLDGNRCVHFSAFLSKPLKVFALIYCGEYADLPTENYLYALYTDGVLDLLLRVPAGRVLRVSPCSGCRDRHAGL